MYNDYETIYQTKIIDYFWTYFSLIAGIIIILLILYGLSHIFKKASIKKVYAYIPFLNLYKLLEICGISKIHMLLIFIPIINIFTFIKISYSLSECFNKHKSYSLLLLFLPFIGYPLLGLTNEKFVGINNKKVKTIVIEEIKKETVEVDTPSEVVKRDSNIAMGTNTIKNNDIKVPDNELILDTNILNKPEKVSDEFVECPNCHKKVKKISDTCFWCGAKLDQ